MSSAGNTRGLIEATITAILVCSMSLSSAGNTRGLIEAASWGRGRQAQCRASLPRGIPAASLKRGRQTEGVNALGFVFRGEYPRPH